MRFVMRASNIRKSVLLSTNHSHHCGAMLKVCVATDFEVFGGRNRSSF